MELCNKCFLFTRHLIIIKKCFSQSKICDKISEKNSVPIMKLQKNLMEYLYIKRYFFRYILRLNCLGLCIFELFHAKYKEALPFLKSWLVGCFGFNGPLRQYFSLYQAVSQREEEREAKRQRRVKMSKQPPPAPTASAIGPCPAISKL